MYIVRMLLVVMMLSPAALLAADKTFCEEYARVAIKQYWFLQNNPSYVCHENHDDSPVWDKDPRRHFNWCNSEWVSEYKADKESNRRDEYLLKHCLRKNELPAELAKEFELSYYFSHKDNHE